MQCKMGPWLWDLEVTIHFLPTFRHFNKRFFKLYIDNLPLLKNIQNKIMG